MRVGKAVRISLIIEMEQVILQSRLVSDSATWNYDCERRQYVEAERLAVSCTWSAQRIYREARVVTRSYGCPPIDLTVLAAWQAC